MPELAHADKCKDFSRCVCVRVNFLGRLKCLSQRLNGVYGCTGAAPSALAAVILILLTLLQYL